MKKYPEKRKPKRKKPTKLKLLRLTNLVKSKIPWNFVFFCIYRWLFTDIWS